MASQKRKHNTFRELNAQLALDSAEARRRGMHYGDYMLTKARTVKLRKRVTPQQQEDS